MVDVLDIAKSSVNLFAKDYFINNDGEEVSGVTSDVYRNFVGFLAGNFNYDFSVEPRVDLLEDGSVDFALNSNNYVFLANIGLNKIEWYGKGNSENDFVKGEMNSVSKNYELSDWVKRKFSNQFFK